MFYLKAVCLLEFLGPQMLLHYFKSLCHANGARTPRKGRGANPRVLEVRGAHVPCAQTCTQFSCLAAAWQSEARGQLLPCTQTPSCLPGLSQQQLLQCSVVMSCKCLMGSLSLLPIQMAQVIELVCKD